MYIALAFGSNTGNRLRNIKNAIKMIDANGITLVKISQIYKSKALLPLVKPSFLTTNQWNQASQMYFLNCVGIFKTTLSPFNLLKTIQKAEIILGKKKLGHWLPRKIDIDIIFYGNIDFKINSKILTIPHKEYKKRKFVTKPLQQIL